MAGVFAVADPTGVSPGNRRGGPCFTPARQVHSDICYQTNTRFKAMVRPVSEIPTEREAQVMEVLWRLGRATADQVREALPGGPHDSTVRTLLRALEAKGYVAHDDRGKAYVYRAAVSQAKAQRTALKSLLRRLFGGSAESLLLRLVEDERI